MQQETLSTASTTRWHGLDALRGGALLLGVLLHASMSFLPGAQYFWLAADSQPDSTVGLMFYVPHMFRMLLFFLLAGFFGRLLHQRLGTRAFVGDRWRRIGKPLLIFWAPMLVSLTAVIVWGVWLANNGQMPKETPPGPTFMPDNFPLTHLWFLYELSLCYAGWLLLRVLIKRLDKHQQLHRLVDRLLSATVHPFGNILLALPLMLTFYGREQWYAWFGIPTPDQTLYPNLPVLASYWLAFAVGWLLHRQTGLLAELVRRWHWHLLVALTLTVFCLTQTGLAPLLQPAEYDGAMLAYIVAYSLAAWQWTFGLIGAAQRFAGEYRPWRRYLADASYWIYIMHLPLVVALQISLRELALSPWLKLSVIVGVTMLVLIACYALFVRRTALGAMLNGRRLPPLTA